MSDIRINETTGDMELVGNDLSLTTGAFSIKQHLKQKLGTFFGEWFLDTSIGLPYFEHILVKNPNPVVIDSLFKNVIINTPGILQLDSFSLDLNQELRNLTLTFKAKTIEGDVEFSEILP